jgi:hypothetical protein
MGELSNKIGKKGENIIETLFKEYLGFPMFRDGLSIKCHHQETHANLRNNKSKTHGIDGLVYYKSPLDESVLEVGFVSVKTTDKPYPAYPRTKFKEHFIDLATGLECFKFSQLLLEAQKNARNVKKTRIIGLLFWISNHDECTHKEILGELAKSQLESLEVNFDHIIVIDNARLQFLVRNLERIKLLSNNNYQFVYPETGLNYIAKHNEGFNTYMPMEFFAYGVLPMRYEINGSVVLDLSCPETFSEENLVQVISMAKSFDKLQATEKINIVFPDYNFQNHDDIVNKVLSYFDDQNFTKLINIRSQNADFRNL